MRKPVWIKKKKKKQGKKIYLTSKDYILEISVREPRQGMYDPLGHKATKQWACSWTRKNKQVFWNF